MSRLLKLTGWALLATSVLGSQVAIAQSETAADQSAFQDDTELMQLDNAQVRQLEGQEASAEAQAAADEQRTRTYRLYAQKKVEQLEKLKGKSKDNDNQLLVLQTWLKADANMRLRDQQMIQTLRQRIANLEQTQNQTMTNLQGDVSAMRDAANEARADEKFRQQMQINQFNELQTEMGYSSYYRPRQGPSYGMGGMGFNGGQSLFGGGY